MATTDRLALLVDGADYFAALRVALARARRSILIAGWDIDGRMQLSGSPGETGDGLPTTLREFLVALVDRRPELHVDILVWDYTLIYSLDRQALTSAVLDWTTPSRMRLAMDDAMPTGACLHWKLVVIDDRVAFCGGIDLTSARWDTPAHVLDDPRRKTPDGSGFAPFHDVQMVVDGAAARALGDLARARWKRATGEAPEPPPPPPPPPEKDTAGKGAAKEAAAGAGAADDPWPTGVTPEAGPCAVDPIQTLAAHDGGPTLTGIADAYVDAIRRARRSIFVENQYLTATVVLDALVERLAADDPPEVVLVSSRSQIGWLEDATMGQGRARFLRRLRDTGRCDRVRVVAPVIIDDEGAAHDVKVHTKLMVVDDDVLTVGSANLANRSMGFDCELNLLLKAAGERDRGFCRSVRERLLAEHLGLAAAEFSDLVDRRGSVLAALDEARERAAGRTLVPIEPDPLEDGPLAEALATFGDPERPVDFGRLIRERLGLSVLGLDGV